MSGECRVGRFGAAEFKMRLQSNRFKGFNVLEVKRVLPRRNVVGNSGSNNRVKRHVTRIAAVQRNSGTAVP